MKNLDIKSLVIGALFAPSVLLLTSATHQPTPEPDPTKSNEAAALESDVGRYRLTVLGHGSNLNYQDHYLVDTKTGASYKESGSTWKIRTAALSNED